MANPLQQLSSALADRYQVLGEIGAGGMATVYLARDLRHERQVALKVLNPELGAVLGVERFLAEIRVTANLQHPNLLPLFDSGQADGLLFYVMPYVEGESLRVRLERERQLPVDESVRLAVGVASALDYAHRHAVIHRDLKPENILLHEGQPLVADFGIALAVSNAGGNRITQTGLSLGTPHYMSPEQATGDRTIDGRTDIYSLGAVLYECLTGEPPHTGSTSQQVIARVLTDKPRPVRSTRELVPVHVDAAVMRALAKLPADRFATAHEFAAALVQPGVGADTAASLTAPATRQVTLTVPTAKIRRVTPWLFGASALALAAWGWLRPVPVQPAIHARFELTFSDSARRRVDIGGANTAISPDGSRIVYVGGSGGGRLYSRPVDDLDARAIPGTEGARNPRFSPDGVWLAFGEGNRIRRVPAAGGPAATLVDSAGRFSWGDENVIVFTQTGGVANNGLWLTSAAGGSPEHISRPDTAAGEIGHTWPEVLLGGRAALFVINTASESYLATMRLSDRRTTRLNIQGQNPRYLPTGHVLFGNADGTVSVVPFDAKRLAITGPAVTVLENVVVKGGGAVELAVSRNGTLVYIEGSTDSRLMLVDRAGKSTPLLQSSQPFIRPRISPSGELIALAMRESPRSTKMDAWVLNIASGTLTRMTTNGSSGPPAWTADGRRLAWVVQDDSGRTLYWQAWDGSGRPEAIVPRERKLQVVAFAPNGQFFISQEPNPSTDDIVLVRLDSARSRSTLVGTPANEVEGRISPDSRWLAYMSNESGRYEIYVRRIEGEGGRHQISSDGGADPAWAPDGRTVFYRGGGRMMAASVTLGTEVMVTRRDTLFLDTFLSGAPHSYDITPDGQHFVMLARGAQNERALVILGWFDELRGRLVPGGRK